MKVDILAIGVHPDDVELGCAGTLLKHIDKGYQVGICDLTMGQLGTRGTPELRLQEAERSRQIMGAVVRENLGMEDGWFTHCKENILKIATVLRKYQPEIVLANAIEDRHPDHGRAAKLIADACFYAGLKAIHLQSGDTDLPAWRPKVVYHYIQDRNIAADFVVDVSPYMDKKMDCIMAFSSQFYDPTSTEPSTPISGKDFIENQRAKQKVYGRPINAEYAEGFTVNRYIGVENLFDLR